MDPGPTDLGGANSALARSLVIALLAFAGLAFHLSPWSKGFNQKFLDMGFGLLRALHPKPAPQDIIIVGLDSAPAAGTEHPYDPSLRKLPDALVRIARGEPRAIALDMALPTISLEASIPGFDAATKTALALAQAAAPLVVGLSVDTSRQLVAIHEPLLAGVDARAFAFRLLPRDDDGTVRRIVLSLPTRQGNWPTLSGWLCEVLSGHCEEGLIDYALGSNYPLLPLSRLLEHRDDESLRRLFQNRVVLVAPVMNPAAQLKLVSSLADWAPDAPQSAAVLGHAQTLRTLLHGSPVREVPLPVVIVVIAVAALLAAAPRHLAWANLPLAVFSMFLIALLLLRAGHYLPLAAPLATVLISPLPGRWIQPSKPSASGVLDQS